MYFKALSWPASIFIPGKLRKKMIEKSYHQVTSPFLVLVCLVVCLQPCQLTQSNLVRSTFANAAMDTTKRIFGTKPKFKFALHIAGNKCVDCEAS